MAKVYLSLINKELWTIENVPAKWVDEVNKLMNGE